tara:strand:+ start:1731 stop:2948 length:1218 start_codon:yes stop_codon:yes gene_type:complete
MSDMRHVYNAYAAVHNPEIKKNLEESRDAFSKMNLNQLMDQDLYEASEEILEKVFFQYDLDIPTAESLIEAILSDALEGDRSPIRTEKIERISEAFASAFDRIKEKSIRVAKESYTDYLYKKDQLSRITSNSNLDLPKQRLHTSLVAEDKRIVRDGLLEIIEGKINAGLQAYLDKKKGKKSGKDHDEKNGKHDNGNGNGDKKSGKGGGKPDFLDLDKDGDKKESMKKAAKDKKMNEGIEDILARLEKKRISKGGDPDESPFGKKTGRAMKAKQDQVRRDAGMKEAYTVTNADKKGNTPAYQGYKAGKKNKLTGKPLYKAADHMKEDLLASGVFSEHEITKILWSEFDESREYAQNPEKYHDSQGYDKKLEKDKPFHKRSRAARMADPERGINSPAFKKFMADRGM